MSRSSSSWLSSSAIVPLSGWGVKRVSYFLPFWAIFSIFLTPYFLIPAAAATAAGFLAPDFLASFLIILKRAPLPSFALATYFSLDAVSGNLPFGVLDSHSSAMMGWVAHINSLWRWDLNGISYGVPPSRELSTGGVGVGTGYGG